MLRYIFLKLSGFTSKKEFSISSSCNQMLFRPSTVGEVHREGRRPIQSKSQHKRSYSFPCRSAKSNRLIESDSPCRWPTAEIQGVEECQRKYLHQSVNKNEVTKTPSSVKCDTFEPYSTNLKKSRAERALIKNNYHEMSCIDETERYELEAARPRKSQSELVFNVFDYVARDVDLTDYLQPNNLKPFGSNENIYLPLLTSHKNINADNQSNQVNSGSISDSKFSKVKELENIRPPGEVEVKREVATVTKPFREIIRKHKALNPSSKAAASKTDKVRVVSNNFPFTRTVKATDRSNVEDTVDAVNDSRSYRGRTLPFSTKSSVKIDPPPFLAKRDDVFSSISFRDMNIGTKRNIANYMRVQTPWPAYSDHVRTKTKKSIVTYPAGTEVDDSTEKHAMEDKSKTLIKKEAIKGNLSQRRALSMEHITVRSDTPPPSENRPQSAKSSIYMNSGRNPVSQSLISLNSKGVAFCPSHTYAKFSRYRKLEPKPCKGRSKKKKKCFLPSKIRLKPPECITRPEKCPRPPTCPPRADDCLNPPNKKLPYLPDGPCDCQEPEVPDKNPKLKRLLMAFKDPERPCPCKPAECPCNPPPRADDCLHPKDHKLSPYIPGHCECVEPPPMAEPPPLVRLQKKQVPECPRKPCAKVPCADAVRADDCAEETIKELKPLPVGNCECAEPPVPITTPKLRRLQFPKYKDIERICPCIPCKCPDSPIRADSNLSEKLKRLPVLKPNRCDCLDPPLPEDVPPLKRLEKVHIPEKPKKCPPKLDCEAKGRADDCIVEKEKTLPKLRETDCRCVEPFVPCCSPTLKRLAIKHPEQPRPCPCKPKECPCKPPPRADETLKPRDKRLIPLVAKDCPCVEPCLPLDVPLVRLQKQKVPECPRQPCGKPPCADAERADDCLEETPKSLPFLEPKPCPCIETEMVDVPKLKRLSLKCPEPPRVCPLNLCPPSKCWRADDCVTPKVKKLPPIKPGECPCIEPKILDVKPLPRLKCKDGPMECMEVDPCIETPRADMGCWEYLEDADDDANKFDTKDKKEMNYKQKRKFNTDSRVNLGKQGEMKSTQNLLSGKITENRNMKINMPNIPKNLNTNKTTNIERKADRIVQHNTVSNIPIIVSKLGKHDTQVTRLDRNSSLPTLLLLKELDLMDLEGIPTMKNDNDKCKPILTPSPSRHGGSLLSANVRKLSTAVLRSAKPEAAAQFSSKASKTPGSSKSPCCSKPSKTSSKSPSCKDKEESCKLSKCPPMVLKNCVTRVENPGCAYERTPVCCDKKQSPNPAFSECMDEKVEPFSNTSQWTCDKKEYGFEHHPKKLNQPIDKLKDEKKFSTSTVPSHYLKHMNKAENAIISYFTARYSKPNAQNKLRNTKEGETLTQPDDSQIKRDLSGIGEDVVEASTSKTTTKELVLEEQSPKLLRQKSNCIVVGGSSRNMSTRDTGLTALRPRTSGLLRPRLHVSQNALRKNMSSSPTKETSDEECRSACKHLKYDEDRKPPIPCRTKCPKLQRLDNCPERARTVCERKYPKVHICEKLQAPYPSFSELMDNEMEDRLTECPVDRERVQRLQPKYTVAPPLNVLSPVLPQQGRIDPKIEEKCIRERLCLDNVGLTQDCTTFGDFIKPMKAKNYIKERNRDCERIEELKKMGQWPPKRRFSTAPSSRVDCQRRNMCSSAHCLTPRIINKDEKLKETEQAEKEKSKGTNTRCFHALCSNNQANPTEETSSETYHENQLQEMDEHCKYLKLRNVQWRISHFQKWYKLEKTNTFPNFSKSYHTCSKLKYRTFVKPSKNVKCFSATVANNATQNSSLRGVICTKATLNIIKKNIQKPKNHSTLENLDILAHRGISTTMPYAKDKKDTFIRFPIYPRPIKKYFKKDCDSVKKGISGKYNPLKRLRKKSVKTQVKSLQPKYPCLPEVDRVPYQPCKRSTIRKNYVVNISDKKPKGKSYDCTALDNPFIRLNSALDRKQGRCTPCGEVFLRSKKVKPERFKVCPKFPKPDPCDLSDCKEPKECFTAVARDPCAFEATPEGGISEVRCSSINSGSRSSTCPCIPAPCPAQSEQKPCPCPEQPCSDKSAKDCPSNDSVSAAMINLWRQIVKYFQAKPNCPTPEEWRRRVLRERAEKAARAAGLCVCDPKDLPRNVSNRIDCSQGQKAVNSNNNGCFTARKDPCKTSTRHYSSGLNWKNAEEKRKLMEEEKKKRATQKLSEVFIEKIGHEDDISLKCPDPLLESVLKAAILNKNSLTFLDKSPATEMNDECICYSLKILPSDLNALDECFRDNNKFNQSKHFADITDHSVKAESVSEMSYEELEKVKTNTLVNELDKLLMNENSHKKN